MLERASARVSARGSARTLVRTWERALALAMARTLAPRSVRMLERYSCVIPGAILVLFLRYRAECAASSYSRLRDSQLAGTRHAPYPCIHHRRVRARFAAAGAKAASGRTATELRAQNPRIFRSVFGSYKNKAGNGRDCTAKPPRAPGTPPVALFCLGDMGHGHLL
jgi:hypothetical protein